MNEASSPSVALTLGPQSIAAKKIATISGNRSEEKEEEISMVVREEKEEAMIQVSESESERKMNQMRRR